MGGKKYEVVVRSLRGDTTIEVRTSCIDKSEISKEIDEITKVMNIDLSSVATTPVKAISGLGRHKEEATLTNPPYTYTPTDAVREILNPSISKWGQLPRSVKEIQNMLMQLGIPGMTDRDTLDRVIRALAEKGDLRRDKVDRVWKYYLAPKRTVNQ